MMRIPDGSPSTMQGYKGIYQTYPNLEMIEKESIYRWTISVQSVSTIRLNNISISGNIFKVKNIAGITICGAESFFHISWYRFPPASIYRSFILNTYV